MKKLLVSFLLISYSTFNSNLSLRAMDSGESISQTNQNENQKGFKAWIRANPKKTAAIVVAAIATIIGSGIGIHRLATKHWIWQGKDEGKQAGNGKTPKAKELTSKELESKKKLEENRKKYLKFGPTLEAVEQIVLNDSKFKEDMKNKTNEFLTSIGEKPVENFEALMNISWDSIEDRNKGKKEDIHDFKVKMDKFLEEKVEIVKQNFDPSQITADNIRKFEEIESKSLGMFSYIYRPFIPGQELLKEAQKQEHLTFLQEKLTEINNAIGGDVDKQKELNGVYPFLDLNKAKDILESSINTTKQQ